MAGEVCALFYRYKAVGGFEYVADFLIGPRAGSASLGTHPGDSGTLWLLDRDETKELPMPMALQWGGQVFLSGSDKTGSSYALATGLMAALTLGITFSASKVIERLASVTSRQSLPA